MGAMGAVTRGAGTMGCAFFLPMMRVRVAAVASVHAATTHDPRAFVPRSYYE